MIPNRYPQAGRAQQWHDTDHGSCEDGCWSSCWCCCTVCDPEWGHIDRHTGQHRPNPFWADARKEMGR